MEKEQPNQQPHSRIYSWFHKSGEGFKRVMSERPEMSEAIVAELVRRMRGMMAQASKGEQQ